MFIVIAGGGSIGSELVHKFIQLKKEIIVIERDEKLCDEIYAQFGVETINGDATRISVLKQAGLDRADVAIATTRDDAHNLAFSVLAKSFSVPEIIVRMNKTTYYEAYRTVGVSQIVNVVDNVVLDILHQVDKSDVKHIARLGEGAMEFFVVHIPEKGSIVGKTISEISSHRKMSKESIITGMFDIENNEFKISRGNVKIKGNTDLFVITKPELVKKTAEFLVKVKK